MASQFLIYGLTDPRTGEIRYVGQSSTGFARPSSHGSESKLRSAERTYKTRWIRQLKKLGLSYDIVILEEVPGVSDLDDRERFWISRLKHVGNQLTNSTEGGHGTRGFKHREESKLKSSLSQSGPKNHGYGKRQSEEAQIKRSRSLGGRPVIDGNGVIYQTAAEAARRTGFGEANIHRVLKRYRGSRSLGGGRGRPSCGKGLTFDYYDEADSAEPASSINAAPTVTKD